MIDPDDEFWTDEDRIVEDIGTAVDDLDFDLTEKEQAITGPDADEREVLLDVEPDDY